MRKFTIIAALMIFISVVVIVKQNNQLSECSNKLI